MSVSGEGYTTMSVSGEGYATMSVSVEGDTRNATLDIYVFIINMIIKLGNNCIVFEVLPP
jgi:hypothetical protein